MIDLDNAATTFPKPPQVLRAASGVMAKLGANPGRSGHRMSLAAGRVVMRCREALAELLRVADALITDYSSCAGDYALLRRPIFLYQDDLADYMNNDRALYFDMADSPYWVSSTPEEMDALIDAYTPEAARENCDAILAFYGECESGRAAEQIAEYIIDKLQ